MMAAHVPFLFSMSHSVNQLSWSIWPPDSGLFKEYLSFQTFNKDPAL